MHTEIVFTPSSEIRKSARITLDGRWKDAVIAVLILEIILKLPEEVINIISDPNYFLGFKADGTLAGFAYNFVANGIFCIAVAAYFLNMTRGRKVHFTDIFNGFEYAFKSLGLFFTISLFVTLWSLCLIVPGIIAAIRYSQAFFILAEHPDKSIMACIEESKIIMNGNKSKFFALTLSFAGWALLASIPQTILIIIGEIAGFDGMGFTVLCDISLIPVIWVHVYLMSAYANFYELLRGNRNFTKPEDYIYNR